MWYIHFSLSATSWLAQPRHCNLCTFRRHSRIDQQASLHEQASHGRRYSHGWPPPAPATATASGCFVSACHGIRWGTQRIPEVKKVSTWICKGVMFTLDRSTNFCPEIVRNLRSAPWVMTSLTNAFRSPVLPAAFLKSASCFSLSSKIL